MNGQYSPFANAIKNLLDDTDFFDRSEWAYFFCVPESSIEDWTTDKSLPQPNLIRMMLDVLRSRGNAKGQLEEFDRLASLPARHISPLGEHMEPTVEEFMKKTLVDFGRHLRGRPADQQTRILTSGCWL